MVRVMSCHHFAAQRICVTDNEPFAQYASDGKVFVATSGNLVEVRSIVEENCPLITKFPTVARVKDIAYSKIGDYVATIEEKSGIGPSKRWARIYTNWTNHTDETPMKVCLAGHMTRSRTGSSGLEDSFQIIEIPLKANPRCISIEPASGALVIGVGSTVLFYGFCTKTLALTTESYVDVKCLLELKFSFKIKHVSVCEQFIACASARELQIVSFQVAVNETEEGTVITEQRQMAEERLSVKSGDVNEKESLQQKDASAEDVIVNHENCIEWDLDTTDESKLLRFKTLEKQRKRYKERTARKNVDELFGPLEKTPECPVSLEYEDVCNLDEEEEIVPYISSIKTYIYKKYQNTSSDLHSLQLIPVYRENPAVSSTIHSDDLKPGSGSPAAGLSSDEDPDLVCGSCTWDDMAQSHELVGLYCYVSTTLEGYMYKIVDKPQLLTTYQYTSNALQVCVGESTMYVVTQSSLEIFTTRTMCSTMHDVIKPDRICDVVPSTSLIPCLIGIHPFISPQSVVLDGDKLVLFTRHSVLGDDDNGETEETSNWSLYVLTVPAAQELYKDMVELYGMYNKAALTSTDILHLMQESFLLARTQHFLNRTQGTQNDALVMKRNYHEAALNLALYYARSQLFDARLCLPYFELSGLKESEILKHLFAVCQTKETHREFIIEYLEKKLFQGVEFDANQDLIMGILQLYSTEKPSDFSSIVLLTKLTLNEECVDFALRTLEECITKEIHPVQTAHRSSLDLLAIADLHLKQGNQAEAEQAIWIIQESSLIELCRAIPAVVLTKDNLAFTAIISFLRHHRTAVFFEVLQSLIKESVITLHIATHLLKSFHASELQNGTLAFYEYILQVSINKEAYKSFIEAVPLLGELYIKILSQSSKTLETDSLKKSLIENLNLQNKGSLGAFGKRLPWLNSLPPFKDEDPRRVCLVKGTHKKPGSTVSPYLGKDGTVRVERKQLTQRIHDCDCLSCNDILLRLQSLLCLPLESQIYHHITTLLSGKSFVGIDSIRLLCLCHQDINEALISCLNDYPCVTPSILKHYVTSDKIKWKELIKSSLDRQKNNTESLENMLHDVLELATAFISVEELLEVIPRDEIYQKYVLRCQQQIKAKALKKDIIERYKDMMYKFE